MDIAVQFILCSHVTTTATRRATNADKTVTTSGQPGGLQPCRFPTLQSINDLDHMSQNVQMNKYINKIKNEKNPVKSTAVSASNRATTICLSF